MFWYTLSREPWLTSATVFNSLSATTRVDLFIYLFFLGLVAQTHRLLSNPKGTFTGVTLHKGITGFGATSGPLLLDSVLYSFVLLQSSSSTNHHSGENTRSLVEFKRLKALCS